MLFDVPREQRIELFGGLPRKSMGRASCIDPAEPNWWIYTPFVHVSGRNQLSVLIQGGIHSQAEQLSHKVRQFAKMDYSVVCLDQSGAATVQKSPNFYDTYNYARFVERDRDILRTSRVDRVIAYGSSLGAAASIALAAEEPERVAAVIAVNPASMIRQNSWLVSAKFALSARQKVTKDFVPPPTERPSLREMLREGLGKAKELIASDIGLGYLQKTLCPVFIYTGSQDHVFPTERLKSLEDSFGNVTVIEMDGAIHSDPNSRRKIDWLVNDAVNRI